ncbi:hypothetical protein NL676_008276 [Syzygium grande]|nr:hypothetical protein NL676_008276 [Syzygium grande]
MNPTTPPRAETCHWQTSCGSGDGESIECPEAVEAQPRCLAGVVPIVHSRGNHLSSNLLISPLSESFKMAWENVAASGEPFGNTCMHREQGHL